MSVVLVIGCSNEAGIRNEQATKDFQPEIDELKGRLAQLELRLTDLEKAAPAPDTKVSGAVVAPPSMTIWSAAAKGNQKEIELHIVAGTDLDSLDNIGQAALHHARQTTTPTLSNCCLRMVRTQMSQITRGTLHSIGRNRGTAPKSPTY